MFYYEYNPNISGIWVVIISYKKKNKKTFEW